MKCYVTFYFHAVLLTQLKHWFSDKAWDVQSCLFTLKLVVKRKEWWRSLALRSARVCGASRLRHRIQSWSRLLESMLVLGLYQQHVSEASQKRLSEAFIQWSVMPHQRLSKHHLLLEFSEKKKNKYCIRSVHMRTEPKDPYRNCSVQIRVPLHP